MRYLFVLWFMIMIKITYSQELSLKNLNLQFDNPIDITSTYIDSDPRLFVTEKSGRILVIDNAQ